MLRATQIADQAPKTHTGSNREPNGLSVGNNCLESTCQMLDRNGSSRGECFRLSETEPNQDHGRETTKCDEEKVPRAEP